MDAVSDVIELFGGTGAFAKAINRPESHVRTMKARRSIPPAYWAKIVEAARKRRLPGVTLEGLVRMHSASEPARAAS
jgi:hypothetical protein